MKIEIEIQQRQLKGGVLNEVYVNSQRYGEDWITKNMDSGRSQAAALVKGIILKYEEPVTPSFADKSDETGTEEG